MNDFFDMDSMDGGDTRKRRYMVIDGSNFLWRNRFAQTGMDGSAEEINAFAIHTALYSLLNLYRKHKPDKIVMCFDNKSWRKAVLPTYKARRHEDRKKDVGIQEFYKQIDEFEVLLRDHSSIICLKKILVEADDWIARWVQTHPEDEHIIVSNDGDFHQLQKHANVKQWNPMKDGNWVDVENPHFALFLKCFRGETKKNSDNIPSAYPRIYEAKLKKAFEGDDVLYNEIMNHMVPDITKEDPENPGEFKMVKVSQLYERNKLLMDLEKQPKEIIEMMDDIIDRVDDNVGKFEMFYFLQYLGRRKLQRIADNVDQFIPVLSC